MNCLEANIFPIANLKDLATRYRTYRLRGLNSASHDYFKNRDFIVRRLSSSLKAPVDIYEMGEEVFLVVPENAPDLPNSLMMVRTPVRLDPIPGVQILDYTNRNPETDRLCTRFINFMVQGPLYSKIALWQPHSGGPFYEKTPAEVNGVIGRYEGFTVRAVITDDGGIGLCVDITSCFVDQRPLSARISRQDFRKLKGRHAVYRFGHQWYDIALFERHDLKVNEYNFMADGKLVSLAEYIETQSRKPNSAGARQAGPGRRGRRVSRPAQHGRARRTGRPVPPHLRYRIPRSAGQSPANHHAAAHPAREDPGGMPAPSGIDQDRGRNHAAVADARGDSAQALPDAGPSVRERRPAVRDGLEGRTFRFRVEFRTSTRRKPERSISGLFFPDPASIGSTCSCRRLWRTVGGQRFIADLTAAVDNLYPHGEYGPIPVVYNDVGIGRTFVDQARAILAAAKARMRATRICGSDDP